MRHDLRSVEAARSSGGSEYDFDRPLRWGASSAGSHRASARIRHLVFGKDPGTDRSWSGCACRPESPQGTVRPSRCAAYPMPTWSPNDVRVKSNCPGLCCPWSPRRRRSCPRREKGQRRGWRGGRGTPGEPRARGGCPARLLLPRKTKEKEAFLPPRPPAYSREVEEEGTL